MRRGGVPRGTHGGAGGRGRVCDTRAGRRPGEGSCPVSGGPIPTVMVMSRAGVSVMHMSRETMTSRLIDYAGRAPHLADVAVAITKGLAFVVLPASEPFPFIHHDETRPMLFVVGDDLTLADGPAAFHRKTLRKLLGRAVFVGVLPGAPDRAFYGRAVKAALASRGWAVLVETQPQQRDAWVRFAARHAKAPVEIAGAAAP